MVTFDNEKTRFTIVKTASADGRIQKGFMIVPGLKKLPKYFTSELQPCDVSLNNPFKDHHREKFYNQTNSPNTV